MGPVDLASVEQPPHGATARRLEWPLLPPYLRDIVAGHLGAPVAEAVSQDSGFTPGLASVLTGTDGSQVFLKAASTKAQRQFAESYAEEIARLRSLPDDIPSPKLLWTHCDDDWVVLGFEVITGTNPARPWRQDQLDACLDTIERVAEVTAPVVDSLGLDPIHEDLPDLLDGWAQMRRYYPDWPHLEEAAELTASFVDIPDNCGFVHADARDDNFVIDAAGTAWLCDWNWPALGPAWLDMIDVLVQARADGLDADAILAERTLSKDVAPEHIDSALAALCGFHLVARDRPVPHTSPYLRMHSRWTSEAVWDWLAARRGW